MQLLSSYRTGSVVEKVPIKVVLNILVQRLWLLGDNLRFSVRMREKESKNSWGSDQSPRSINWYTFNQAT